MPEGSRVVGYGALEALAAHLEVTAVMLLMTGNKFDLIWAIHLEKDAKQIRLLAQADRHQQRAEVVP